MKTNGFYNRNKKYQLNYSKKIMGKKCLKNSRRPIKKLLIPELVNGQIMLLNINRSSKPIQISIMKCKSLLLSIFLPRLESRTSYL